VDYYVNNDENIFIYNYYIIYIVWNMDFEKLYVIIKKKKKKKKKKK